MSEPKFNKVDQLHVRGTVCLTADKSQRDKEKVYSCGRDKELGVWKCSSSGELTYEIKDGLAACYGVAVAYDNVVYVGASVKDAYGIRESPSVIKFEGVGEKCLSSGPIVQFQDEVTAMDISSDGQHLVAGSRSFVVKRQNIEDLQEEPDRYECGGEVVHISVDPKNRYFAVSSGDGVVQIYHLVNPDRPKTMAPIAQFKVYHEFSSSTKTPRIQSCWSPDGEYLYVASKGGVTPIKVPIWKQEKIMNTLGTERESYSLLTMSAGGDLLAAYTLEGNICVWRLPSLQTVSHVKCSKEIGGIVTSMVFNPSGGGNLILADEEGHLTTLTGMCSAQTTSGFGADDVGQDDDMEVDIGLIKAQHGFGDNGFEGLSKSAARINGGRSAQIVEAPREPCATIKDMKIPEEFASGCTPSENNQRYLIWNKYGTIRAYENADESIIEVVFHDKTTHPDITIDNAAAQYTLGDMTNEVVALASYENEDKGSELLVHHIAAWDRDSREWTQKMPEGENVTGLSIGSDFVAVATTLRFVRIFTAAGTQRFIFSMNGPLLSMCAWDGHLALVRSTGAVVITAEDNYEHQLTVDLYTVKPFKKEVVVPRDTVQVALGAGTDLEWVGFTNCGNLATMDSGCVLRLLVPTGCWAPIFLGSSVLKNAEADFIWPICVIEKPTPQLRYVYCKGSRYPLATKNLAPVTVPWNVPIASPENERSKLEQQLMLTELAQVTNELMVDPRSVTAAIDLARIAQTHLSTLVKMFAISSKVGRDCRAAELANMTTPSGVQMMCSYAAKTQKAALAEKVAAVGRGRIQSEDLSLNTSLPSEPRKIQLKRKGAPGLVTSNTSFGSASRPMSSDRAQTPNAGLDLAETSDAGPASENAEDPSQLNSSACSLNDSYVPPSSAVVNAQRAFSVNPFKRTRAEDDSSNTNSGSDFFEQLSSVKVAQKEPNGRPSSNGIAKPVTKQAKLSFGSTPTSAKNVLDDASNTETRIVKTAFDHWSEANTEQLRDAYTGEKDGFQRFLVQTYRQLPPEEKKKWSEMSKQ